MMHPAVVVDAGVWASGVMPQDANHTASRLWLERYIAGGGLLVAPALLAIELAAALTGRTGHPALAKQAADDLYGIGFLRIVPVDAVLVQGAINLAADLSLRAADAVYVAVVSQMRIPLVSWDTQQRQRAGGIIATYAPGSFPF